ncbi:hypothetical protein NL676_023316 [Syzygium grande]|nr:hypothetical protein NL676_023316 [Syzygium grande]
MPSPRPRNHETAPTRSLPYKTVPSLRLSLSISLHRTAVACAGVAPEGQYGFSRFPCGFRLLPRSEEEERIVGWSFRVREGGSRD